MKKLSVTPSHHERLIGGIYLAVQLLLLPSVLVVCNHLFRWQLSEAELNFLFFCVNFVCVVSVFHQYLIQSAALALGAPLRVLANAMGGYLLYNMAASLVSQLILSMYPDFYNVNDNFISQMLADEFGIIFVGTVLLVPITEEILYRGLLFGSLYNRSRILAYGISTLLFAVLHVYSYIGTYSPIQLLLCLLEYIPAGIILGWIYARTDTLWTSILIHMAVNAIAVFAMR